jgi:hypothetical protein
MFQIYERGLPNARVYSTSFRDGVQLDLNSQTKVCVTAQVANKNKVICGLLFPRVIYTLDPKNPLFDPITTRTKETSVQFAMSLGGASQRYLTGFHSILT